MKYCLLFVITFYLSAFNKVSYADNSDRDFIPVFSSVQQKEPFYFLAPIPAAVKLFDKIDLSFFRNRLNVFIYRYRLQIPAGLETAIDRRLMIWSGWINTDLIEIKIPRLDLEGGYKLIVEYKPLESDETKVFEKPFYVYYVNPVTSAETDKPGVMSLTDRKVRGTVTVNTGTAPETISRSGTETKSPVANPPLEKKPVIVRRNDLNDVKIRVDIIPEIVSQSADLSHELLKVQDGNQNIVADDSDNLLPEALEITDTGLILNLILNDDVAGIKGKNGGNIFHLMNDTLASEDMISMLKNNGILINEKDDEGNTPLHFAILSGEKQYARALIDQGADLNIKNNADLSPLHLAVLLNSEETINDLLGSGAEVNLKGNTGYTALHIASQLNNIPVAANLLSNGAKKGIKTTQGLTAKTIARIQQNDEMVRLMIKEDTLTVNQAELYSAESIIRINPAKQYPDINFSLPYDEAMVKKRQFTKILQGISAPVFAISTTAIVYFRSEANHNYSLSRIAETEAMAKEFYDKGNKYGTSAYISGGFSLVTAYGLIHSTLKKKTISRKMYKEQY